MSYDRMPRLRRFDGKHWLSSKRIHSIHGNSIEKLDKCQ